ncbi:MAG: hypothetical protein H6738_08280 [Alphaproteobacteria bacterium]|nr:hypothetical protein [Alphaproteobacteria bacterium]MCB9696757.1 hypothetical protein [Alphaproteobacteria bacterium]
MDEQSNTMATVSMVSGVAIWVLMAINFCLGFIPILNMLGFLLMPVMFLVGIAGVVTGILGFRQSRVSSIGGGASIFGVVSCLAWFLVEGMLLIFAFGLVAFILATQ